MIAGWIILFACIVGILCVCMYICDRDIIRHQQEAHRTCEHRTHRTRCTPHIVRSCCDDLPGHLSVWRSVFLGLAKYRYRQNLFRTRSLRTVHKIPACA